MGFLLRADGALNDGLAVNFCHDFTGSPHHGFGRNVELAGNVGDLAGLAIAMHADEAALEAKITFPASFHRRFDCDAGVRGSHDGLPVGGVLLLEEQATWHGYNGRGDAVLLQDLTGFDDKVQFGPGPIKVSLRGPPSLSSRT